MKIDKSIPIPERGHGTYTDTFAEMEIGDSLLFEGETQQRVFSRTQHAAKKLGYKFTSQKTAEGTRIWRIA
jgi:uncharacterized protein (DUF2249 family)